MTDSTLGNKVDIPSQEVLQLLERSVLGVKIMNTTLVAGETLEHIKLAMPEIFDNIRQIISRPTGKDAELETCLLIYDGSPPIENVIKSLSANIKAFRWHHGLRLTTRDQMVAEDALRNYLSTSAAKPGSYARNAHERPQATNNSPSGSEEVGDDEDGDEEAGTTEMDYIRSQHTEGQAKEALVGEPYPPDPLVEAIKLREAQYEAARVSIPVISRTHEEERALVSRAKTLLEDVARDPMPTSSQKQDVDQVITAIETQVEQIRLAKKLEDGMKALNAERSEALQRLLPSVTRAGEWLEVNGPESRYRYHSPTDEGDLQESSNTSKLDRVGAEGEQDHPVTDLEHSESEAEGDIDREEASSSDSDLESQLKEWHDGVQSTASGSGVEAEGQAGLQ